MAIDPGIKHWATPRQAEYIDAVIAHGGIRPASRALGVGYNAVHQAIMLAEKKAASQGYAPSHDMTHTAPDPFVVKGVSTYYDREGEVRGQWVKTQRRQGLSEDVIRAAVLALAEEVTPLPPLSPPPQAARDELLAVYAMGDPHFGLYAWKAETGEDYDLETADRLHRTAIDRLVASAPEAGTALLLNPGDFFHADNSKNVTPESGNPLDVDTRHAKVVEVGVRSMAYAVRRLLAKHNKVIVWMLPGNHDPSSAFALALCLELYFESEPRVQVDLSPGLYKFLRFGKVLIGAHHGHGAKPGDLPLLMAVDRAEDWGAALWRYIYVGHIHHDTVKEVQGVRVESLRTLAGKDAWHAGKGYRAGRDMRCIVHHADFGEIERHTCNVAML